MFASRNKTESTITRMCWNDGLLEVLAGTGVLLIGVAWQLDLVPLGAIAPAILIPCWAPLREKIILPRLGWVDVSDVQQGRQRRFLLLALTLGVIALIAGISAYIIAAQNRAIVVMREPVAAAPALIFAVMAVMTAVLISVSRFLLHAGTFVAAGVIVGTLGLEPGWALLSGGLAVLLIGLAVLVRFIIRHPIVGRDESIDQPA
jgi:hypothetical protein